MPSSSLPPVKTIPKTGFIIVFKSNAECNIYKEGAQNCAYGTSKIFGNLQRTLFYNVLGFIII